MNLSNSDRRKAIPGGRNNIRNMQSNVRIEGIFFGNPKPFDVPRLPRAVVRGGMVTRRQKKEDLVRNKTGTRLWKILRAEKFHCVLEIMRSH